MAQEGTQHHGHDGAALQSLGGSVSKEDGNKVEDDVAGGVQDDVGAVGGVKAGHLGKGGQKTLDQAGSCNGGHQRGKDLGQLLQDEVAHALLLRGDGFLFGRGCSLPAQLSHDSIVDLGDFCAADHLELATTTEMTPSKCSTTSFLALLSSRSTKRRRVKQWVTCFTLALPPTLSKMSLATLL